MENLTIEQLKKEMSVNLRKGCVCKVCNQFAKIYSRKITASMAAGLCIIYNESGEDYIHIETLFKNKLNIPSSLRGDIPKLRFWNLLIPKEGEKEDGNPNNGYYKITEKGKRFVEGKVYVYSHVDIYNNEFFGYSEKSKEITIYDALTDKFNYNELMNEKVV